MLIPVTVKTDIYVLFGESDFQFVTVSVNIVCFLHETDAFHRVLCKKEYVELGVGFYLVEYFKKFLCPAQISVVA